MSLRSSGGPEKLVNESEEENFTVAPNTGSSRDSRVAQRRRER